MDYEIQFSHRAAKDFASLQADVQERLVPKIDALALDPRPRGCTKLEGSQDAYRIRVGDYRVVYMVNDQDDLIEIVRIGHRREVYRGMT